MKINLLLPFLKAFVVDSSLSYLPKSFAQCCTLTYIVLKNLFFYLSLFCLHVNVPPLLSVAFVCGSFSLLLLFVFVCHTPLDFADLA